jgi:hypothetical protein
MTTRTTGRDDDTAGWYVTESSCVTVYGRTFTMHTSTVSCGIVDTYHTVIVRIKHSGSHHAKVFFLALPLYDHFTKTHQDSIQLVVVTDLKITYLHGYFLL